MTTNLAGEARRAGARIELESRVDAALVADARADVVIVATGGRRRLPHLELAGAPTVLHAWDVLEGAELPHGHVVVADARCDWVGPGLAIRCARAPGAASRSPSTATCPASGSSSTSATSLLAELHRCAVAVIPTARLFGADEDSVFLQHTTSGEPIIVEDVAALVVAHGPVSDDALAPELRRAGVEAVLVGDALAPRTAEEAVVEALRGGGEALGMTADPSLLAALAGAVGASHVLVDPDVTAAYEVDWSGRYGARARAVVLPASTQEVAAAVRACADHGCAVVPQGGNTGLVGGGVPRGGEVVVSLRRLDAIGPVDPVTGEVTVGAGATLAALQRVADPGLDLAARDSATIGGIVACDAGGARALRHGTARARVNGVEAVLADGSVVDDLRAVTKDNAGYDLSQLLVGCEGTLGVLTRVRWRTIPPRPYRVAALAPVADVAAATAVLARLRGCAPSLEACDFLTHACLELVLRRTGQRSPVAEAPLYLMLECAAAYDPLEELAEGLGDSPAAVAEDGPGRAALWALRESVTEAIAHEGVPLKLDVGVPVGALGELLRRVGEVARARTLLFGHLGDGNVHVNLLGDAPDADAVLALVLELGGTISSEHGIGIAKAAWLERARGAERVAAMRAVKRALDPAGALNPGVVLP